MEFVNFRARSTKTQLEEKKQQQKKEQQQAMEASPKPNLQRRLLVVLLVGCVTAYGLQYSSITNIIQDAVDVVLPPNVDPDMLKDIVSTILQNTCFALV